MERGRQIRIWKRLTLFFIACLGVAICLVGPAACSRQCALTSEDYAVYSAILVGLGKTGPAGNQAELIISEATVDSSSWPVAPSLKELSNETLAHFILRQKSVCHLKPQLDRAISYQLVSADDLDKIFKRGSWAEFYKEYPKSSGTWSLSPIGYNIAKTEALVYVAHGCGGLCGSGHLVVLANQNGTWAIKEQTKLWDS